MTALIHPDGRGDGRIVVATGPDEPVEDYLAALAACGAPGANLRAVSSHDGSPSEIAAMVAQAAGLVLCGGVDVGPERYGEAELDGAGLSVDRARDAFDFELLSAARAAGVPVLGVCRGLQVVNVFLGGSLYQHLPAQRPGPCAHDREPQQALAHVVFAETGEHPMADLLRREPCVVNSVHHQGIKTLAADLVPVALSPDELVEAAALSPANPWWVRGVQWHPENLVELPLQRALWQSFLAATNVGRRDA